MYYAISFLRGAVKKDQTSEKADQTVLTNRISFFGTPDIAPSDKDARFAGQEFSRFRTDRNITLLTVIHGRRRSLGSNESRRMYFRETSTQIIECGKNKKIALMAGFGNPEGALILLFTRDIDYRYREPRRSGEGALQPLSARIRHRPLSQAGGTGE